MNRRTVLVIAALSAALVVVGGGITALTQGSNDTAPVATDAGFAIDPVGNDPASVAVAVMSGIFTWQPSVQGSSWEALRTQQDRLTGVMATAADRPPNPEPAPLPDWAAWARSGDTVTAVVRRAAGAAVTETMATVPVTIAQTVQHTDGQSTPYATMTAVVTLDSASGAWKVANYRLGSSYQ